MKTTIAGYGSVSAAGTAASVIRETYGRGIARWETDQATGLPVFRAHNLPARDEIEAFCTARGADPAGRLALYAAEQAVNRAGWMGQDFSILVGCSRGPTTSWETSYDEYRRTGKPTIRTSPRTTLGSLAFLLADYFGTTEVATGMSVTCSSGQHAILHGLALLHSGITGRVLVGGAEAPLTPFTLRQMQELRVYANPAPGELHPVRPFSDPATGMALGEGAAFLALTRHDPSSPLKIEGIGFSREQVRSPTGISRAGQALQHAMRSALQQSERVPDLILAHAPGTKRGDRAEAAAIRAVFGESHPVVGSFKWATGHTFGASGPLAIVAALQMLEEQVVWGLPYGKTTYPSTPVQTVLVNATGFGGNAMTVCVRSV